MSQVTKPIMLDETGKGIVNALNKQNALIEAMARNSIAALPQDLKSIRDIVRDGLAEHIFHVGDQLIVKWKDVETNTEYEVPHDIVHFGNVTLKDGSVVPGMFLQWHYCLPFAVKFDSKEKESVTEGTYLSEYCYYQQYTASNGDTRYKLLVAGTDYTVGDSIPVGATLFHSAIKDTTGGIVASGYNRWSHSAIRQFLNSKAGKNAWWVAQHAGDEAPSELALKSGFLSGYSEEFLACIRPVKVTTALNVITDSLIGTSEDTYDTFFLPSLEQIYANAQLAGVEGTCFEYWKQAVGKTAPNGWYDSNRNSCYISYPINAKSSPTSYKLRSASTNESYFTWGVSAAGAIGNGYAASDAYNIAPVCVIC